MRPSRPRPQARHPNAGRSSPTLRVPLGLPHGRASPQPGVPPSGVRIVDTRSSVPALTGLDDGYVGYYQAPLRSSDSPSTVSSFEPITPTSKRRPVSPYGFIPIPPGDRAASHRFSPITTPHYDFRHGTPSPSLMSTITDGTIDSLMTIDSPRLANIGFSTPPPLYRPGSPQGRESPRPRTPTGRKSPFTKNDDDSSRKTRIKTEMCMHYAHNRPCPFGANCTYAHGEEELQMTKLLDLEKAGLIDIETYRTKPCLTWVMTGSCPFGKRCTAIHDPRVGGSSPSWLPHTETQGNTMATDINVESLHNKRLNEVYYGTPFGHKFSLKQDSWSDLYKLICNIDYAKGGWIDKQQRRQFHQISNVVKLQIALCLRGPPNWIFKYRPQHIIHEEICMLLQYRAFCLVEDGVVEIPVESYNPSNAGYITVHELAFGPDSDSTARPVALWFSIDESQVSVCTAAQAKRYRYRKSVKKDEFDNADKSVFDGLDNFEMIRPQDELAYNLATDIMLHRLSVLQAERIPHMRERHEALRVYEDQKRGLQKRFEHLRNHWVAWGWPVNHGRDKVHRSTPVPKVDCKYGFSNLEEKGDSMNVEQKLGWAALPIWTVFVKEDFDGDASESIDAIVPASKLNKSGWRLPIFQDLAMGKEIASDRSLPQICPKSSDTATGSSDNGPSETCWKSLLLTPDDLSGVNEWDLVQDHFEKSRSKKVLTIIQSKAATEAPPGFSG